MVPVPQKNPQPSPSADFNAKIIAGTVKPNHFVDLPVSMSRSSGNGLSMMNDRPRAPTAQEGADSHAANGHRSSAKEAKDGAHPPKPSRPYRRATAYTAQYTPSPHLVAKARHDDGLDEPTEKKSREERQRERMSVKEAQRKDDALLALQRQFEREAHAGGRAAVKRQGSREEGGVSGMRRASGEAQDRRRGHSEEERHPAVRGERQASRRNSSRGVYASYVEGGTTCYDTNQHASSHRAPSSPQVNSPRNRNLKSSSNKSSNQNNSSDSQELTEQQIAEYAGKRAMLRLEQEFSNAHNDTTSRNSSFHSATSGMSVNAYSSVMDPRKLSRVPQVSKSDLMIGEYLGRGNFCDVFEVEWALKNDVSRRSTESAGSDSLDDSSVGSDEHDEEVARRKLEYLSLLFSNDIRPEVIPSKKTGALDPDTPIVTSRNLRGSFSQIHTGFSLSSRNLRDPNVMALKCLRPAVRAQPRKFVIGAEDLAHETALLACLDHPNIIKLYGRAKGSFATAFQFGNSKVSCSSGSSNGRKKKERHMNDGYFIILDRLIATLDGRIEEWKEEYQGVSENLNLSDTLPPNVPPPESILLDHLAKRIKVAYSIASALEYLHAHHVVFRDLKPANVGFDCNDCVKMFDFGFATSIAPLLNEQIRSGREQTGYGPLTETCGTRRYMAPEVALKLGYGKEVDVYSFGMLLWEICAMEKPFDTIQTVEDFHDLVVLCGNRPPLNIDPFWTRSLKHLMSKCWSTDPLDRPDMAQVKSMLCVVLRDINVAAMKLKQLKLSKGKNDEESKNHIKAQPQYQQQYPAGLLNKWRRRHSTDT
eukprot:CCRYP_009269-RB/>CCRYP_009269-RB protein AED:0.10 eAED:0.10 QI:171/1/1/1/1/1/5/432/816